MDREQIILLLQERLKPKRFQHSLGVEQSAVELAGIHGADIVKASTAALLHDVMRCYNGSELLDMAAKYGIEPGEYECSYPKVLHAPLGAEYARRELGITDEEIINAIARHTTAAPAMTLLDKVIYISDAIEPGRSYDGVERLRQLAHVDLDRCLLDIIDESIELMERKGKPVHPDSYEALHYYKKELCK